LYSREVVLKWGALGYLAQCLMFVPLHALSCSYHRHRQQNQKTLIVGSGDLAQLLAEQLSKSQTEALVGLVHHNDNPPDPNSLFPTTGGIVHLRNLISQHDVQKSYIALPVDEMGNIDALYVDLMDINVDVLWVPDTTSMLLLNHSVSKVAGIPVIHLNESPLTANPSAALLKSALDRVLALLAIVVLSPLMLALAVAVKLSSPGPVLFKQPRHGWNGRVFQMLKFRSMRIHQDNGVTQATRHDNRITPVGRFIRRTSLDELPQFFNVLMGDMSLVGPRPHAVVHNDYYAQKIQAYMNRHRIKPGI